MEKEMLPDAKERIISRDRHAWKSGVARRVAALYIGQVAISRPWNVL
jgi:hypothetical protein